MFQMLQKFKWREDAFQLLFKIITGLISVTEEHFHDLAVQPTVMLVLHTDTCMLWISFHSNNFRESFL